MSKMPESIRIGTAVYRVTTDPDEYKAESATYGWTSNTAALIGVSPHCSPDVQRLSLWHEVLHALHATVMGQPSWRDLPKNAYNAEELVVRRWEHPTLAVLRDNPDLVDYLMGERPCQTEERPSTTASSTQTPTVSS